VRKAIEDAVKAKTDSVGFFEDCGRRSKYGPRPVNGRSMWFGYSVWVGTEKGTSRMTGKFL
jgi:hypothetical protein